MNRLDYFEFDSFRGLYLLNIAFIALFLVLPDLIKMLPISGGMIGVMFYCWTNYCLIVTVYLTIKKRCRYRGYPFYPSRIVTKLKAHRKSVELMDYDTIATLQASGVDRAVVDKLRSFDYRD